MGCLRREMIWNWYSPSSVCRWVKLESLRLSRFQFEPLLYPQDGSKSCEKYLYLLCLFVQEEIDILVSELPISYLYNT